MTGEQRREGWWSVPGALGVFVVIPLVDDDDPGNIVGVRQTAGQIVDYLARDFFVPLTSHILGDRDLVSRVANYLDLRPIMANDGLFVLIPLIDEDNPGNIAGVQRNAALLAESLGDWSARIVDDPNLVADLADQLGR